MLILVGLRLYEPFEVLEAYVPRFSHLLAHRVVPLLAYTAIDVVFEEVNEER